MCRANEIPRTEVERLSTRSIKDDMISALKLGVGKVRTANVL